MNIYSFASIIVIIAILSSGCEFRKDGAIEGTVSPPSAGIQVAAMQSGKLFISIEPDHATGRFRMNLPAGTYDLQVSAEAFPYPMTLSNIVVEGNRTTYLETIELLPSSAVTASITGKVVSAGRAKVSLIYQGMERASVYTDAEGKYLFEGLSPGRYIIRTSAEGYTTHENEIELTDNQSIVQNAFMFYISDTPGVDWSSGRIRVTGTGLPPQNAPNASIRRELARRAAIADGQRKLLHAIEQIKISPQSNIKSMLKQKDAIIKIQGFMQGYRLVGERETEGGRIELDLELPLTGRDSLSYVISEIGL